MANGLTSLGSEPLARDAVTSLPHQRHTAAAVIAEQSASREQKPKPRGWRFALPSFARAWTSRNQRVGYVPLDCEEKRVKRAPIGIQATARLAVLGVLLGILMGCVACLSLWATYHFTKWVTDPLNLDAALRKKQTSIRASDKSQSDGENILGAAARSVLLVFVASILVFIVPSAKGSGNAEIAGTLDGVVPQTSFGITTPLCKILGAILTVSANLPTGMQGPIMFAGVSVSTFMIRHALMLGFLNDGTETSNSATWAERLRDRSDRERSLSFTEARWVRSFAATGAVTGIVAAFRAPITSVIFVLESKSSPKEPHFFMQAALCALTVLLTQWCIAAAAVHADPKNEAIFSYVNTKSDSFNVWHARSLFLSASFGTPTDCSPGINIALLLAFAGLGVVSALLGLLIDGCRSVTASVRAWFYDTITKISKGKIPRWVILMVDALVVAFIVQMAFSGVQAKSEAGCHSFQQSFQPVVDIMSSECTITCPIGEPNSSSSNAANKVFSTCPLTSLTPFTSQPVCYPYGFTPNDGLFLNLRKQLKSSACQFPILLQNNLVLMYWNALYSPAFLYLPTNYESIVYGDGSQCPMPPSPITSDPQFKVWVEDLYGSVYPRFLPRWPAIPYQACDASPDYQLDVEAETETAIYQTWPIFRNKALLKLIPSISPAKANPMTTLPEYNPQFNASNPECYQGNMTESDAPNCYGAGIQPSFRFFATDGTCFYPAASLLLVRPNAALFNLFTIGFPLLFTAKILGLFIATYTIAFIVISGIPLPVGSLAPALLIGAAVGRIWGVVAMDGLSLGTKAVVFATSTDPGFAAAVGAACMYTALFRTPFTAVILVAETTNSFRIVPFLLVGTMATYATASVVRPVAARTQAVLKSVRGFLPTSIVDQQLRVIDVANLVRLPSLPKELLSKRDLQAALAFDPEAELFVLPSWATVTRRDMEATLRRNVNLDGDATIDLHSISNQAPVVLDAQTSLQKSLELFRGAGHLFVLVAETSVESLAGNDVTSDTGQRDPLDTYGEFVLTVLSGEKLRNVNMSFSLDEQDPYIKATMLPWNTPEQRTKTVQSGGVNPVWDAQPDGFGLTNVVRVKYLGLPPTGQTPTLRIEVFDAEFIESNDRSIGVGMVAVDKLLGGGKLSLSVPLTVKDSGEEAGTLKCELEFKEVARAGSEHLRRQRLLGYLDRESFRKHVIQRGFVWCPRLPRILARLRGYCGRVVGGKKAAREKELEIAHIHTNKNNTSDELPRTDRASISKRPDSRTSLAGSVAAGSGQLNRV